MRVCVGGGGRTWRLPFRGVRDSGRTRLTTQRFPAPGSRCTFRVCFPSSLSETTTEWRASSGAPLTHVCTFANDFVLFCLFHFSNMPRRSKPAMCADLGASILIDDSLEYATQCATALKRVLLFGEYPYVRAGRAIGGGACAFRRRCAGGTPFAQARCPITLSVVVTGMRYTCNLRSCGACSTVPVRGALRLRMRVVGPGEAWASRRR